MLAVVAVSCNREEAAERTSADLFTDSISESFGNYVGANLAMQCADYTEEQKIEFLNAFQSVMTGTQSDPALRGTIVAAQILQTIDQLDNHDDITLERSPIVNGFKRIFMMDSVDYAVMMKYGSEFQEFRRTAVDRAREARAAERMAAPEAQQNGRIAADFVNNLKANDSSVQTTESGLTYKIENPGDENKPGANATVKVKYVGKHINGEVFDQSGDQPATFNLRGVVPGFSEGLQLIGKGGKATLYIPGELAYGAEGAEGAGIGPNEMLVFEVELVDVQ